MFNNPQHPMYYGRARFDDPGVADTIEHTTRLEGMTFMTESKVDERAFALNYWSVYGSESDGASFWPGRKPRRFVTQQ